MKLVIVFYGFKEGLEELWRQGHNWALEELQQVRQAEREKVN